jgi:NADPH:quinone reductase
VLVAGGAGAVGHYAIELARFAGARVVTTVSSKAKASLARQAGADAVVNYRDPDAIDQVRAFASRVDRIVEVALGANLELDLAVSGASTVISVYANEPADPIIPTRRLMAANTAIHYVLLYGVSPAQLAAATSWTRAATEAQALSALPIAPFALDDVAAAHDAAEQGAVGKVVVVPG